MKEVRVQDAVGMVLCHDMTEFVYGVRHQALFRKGHIIEQKDIERMLDIGKEHIFVWDLKEGYIHEEEAAVRMAKAAVGDGIRMTEVREGKVNFKAERNGLLKINKELLFQLNSIGNVCFATILGDKFVETGSLLGGTRVIPLVVKKETVEEFEQLCAKQGKVLEVVALVPKRIGIVTTGSEILSGRVEDKFGEVLKAKADRYGSQIMGQVLVGDDLEKIKQGILDFIEAGATFVQVTGGMSVDPDDRTPKAIRQVADQVVTYGTPVLPGAMFMLAYYQGIPIVGLPGCVMYAKQTVYDLIVPRILAGETVTKQDIVELGYGGQFTA